MKSFYVDCYEDASMKTIKKTSHFMSLKSQRKKLTPVFVYFQIFPFHITILQT